jgi:perosamine synthetase
MVSIPVNEPLLDGNEKKYLLECIETGWISSEGPFVAQFEEEMASITSRKQGIAVCNGSVALELAVAALEFQPNDEIILPAFTIISCVAAIIRQNCVPVLFDSHPTTWNMDIADIEAKITSKTKAIMVVHTYGLPVDMTPVLELAEKYGLRIIEDAAEMHGQTYRGRPCGSFGDISTFSFYPNKHVTTGEGGMVVTDDEYLAERCRSLRNLCFQPERRFVHDELGYNFRMTNLQAALGMAQLERLGEFIDRKRAMGKRYTEMLSALPDFDLPLARTDYADNIYWVYGLVLKDGVPSDAQQLMHHLAQKKIGTRPFFWPMHEQPVFRKMGLFKDDRHPVAERLSRRGFYIPSGLALTGKQMRRVVDVLKSVMREIRK